MNLPMRHPEKVAALVLEAALTWEPGARLVGDVMAVELARLAAGQVTTCPHCDSEAWVNIDCDMCLACAALISGEVP